MMTLSTVMLSMVMLSMVTLPATTLPATTLPATTPPVTTLRTCRSSDTGRGACAKMRPARRARTLRSGSAESLPRRRRTPGTRAQAERGATRGAAPGTVDLDAAVGPLLGRNRRSRAFNWQWIADGGKTFTDAPPTATGKTTIANLTPLATIGFRVKVTTTTNDGEWSAIVAIVVH